MPPNQCGVYFDGFYPEEFGQWTFIMATMKASISTEKKKTVSIETVEGPCDSGRWF